MLSLLVLIFIGCMILQSSFLTDLCGFILNGIFYIVKIPFYLIGLLFESGIILSIISYIGLALIFVVTLPFKALALVDEVYENAKR